MRNTQKCEIRIKKEAINGFLETIWNPRKQNASVISAKLLKIVVSRAGFEPATH